ncbi:MAG TPA: PilZ domain-containing protein [Candidatus Acidoferrum sp.]|nr:PilZ domain-containing protein [Candidatus Acidoferrum sp.]
MREPRQQERRRSRRIRIGQPLKVRPSDPHDVPFEETATTKNVSRDGIYFLSKNQTYRAGMRVFVTLPYHFPRDPHDVEYLGQVARIEILPDGNFGIGVQLLSSINSNPSLSPSALKQSY